MPLQTTAKAKNSSLLSAVRPLFSPCVYPQILLQTHILKRYTDSPAVSENVCRLYFQQELWLTLAFYVKSN